MTSPLVFDRWTRSWFSASVIYAAALVVVALFLPAYSGAASKTLSEVNGDKVLLVVAAPLVGALFVIESARLHRRRGRHGVGVVAWVIVGLLFAISALGLLTVGPFILPVPVCLVVGLLRLQETGAERSS